VLFADDTTLPVLDPGRGKTKTGRLWCYAVDPRTWKGPGHPAAAYIYSQNRKGEHPAEHLAGFRGKLQVDGYTGFPALAKRGDGTVELVFCWAHCRRRFYEFYASNKSPLAAEALYRAADIRWQIERSDVMTRPSARERQAYMRGQMNEEWMRLVLKKYPGTKWADLAAFRLIENKVCGEWEGVAKCPDKEADLYENYAKDHPQSPAAPEALYDAAWRRSALIEMYRTEPNQKKAAESKDRAVALAQRIVSQYLQSPWALRAQRLIFYIQQGIPTYGNTAD